MDRHGTRGHLLAWLAALVLLAAGCGDDTQEPPGDSGAEDEPAEVEPPPDDPFSPGGTEPGPGEDLGPTNG